MLLPSQAVSFISRRTQTFATVVRALGTDRATKRPEQQRTSGDRGANSARVALDEAIRPAGPAIGQALRRRLAFFEAPLVAVFLQ